MIEEAEAIERIHSLAGEMPVSAREIVPLGSSLDRILAEPVFATLNQPRFDNSSMDGYAVRASDAGRLGARLTVAAKTQAAGVDEKLTLQAGEAIRIFTGGVLPTGADAVIMQEDVTRSPDGRTLVINDPIIEGENIRRIGGDVCAGQKLGEAGDRVSPALIGTLASQGISELCVHSLPQVTILSTGDEVVPVGTELQDGEIYNSNGPMLQACCQRAGVHAEHRHLRDELSLCTETFRELAKIPGFIIVAGGVSVGERDFVQAAVTAAGGEVDFWRVRVKPGKPFLFGKLGKRLLFGLPGNPVSSFVGFEIFIRPVLERLVAGSESPLNELKILPAAEEMINTGDRPHYLRGIADEGGVRLSGTQQSHALFGLSKANALIRLEPEASVRVGDDVAVRFL